MTSKRAPTLLGCAIVCAALLAPATEARAANAEGAAKALFDHGLEELRKGNYPTACTAFAESYQLNPLPGALFTLAECEVKRGRIATAIKRYEEYLTLYAKLSRDKQLRQRGRDVVSKDQIVALTPKVPKVSVVIPEGAPAGTVTTLDGAPIDRAALSSPILLDPGEHVISAQAPGGNPVETRFSIDKGEQKTLPLEVKAPPPPPPPEPPPSVDGLRVGAFAAGGVGVAGILVGAITGGLTLAKKSVIQKNCKLDAMHHTATCNPTGLDAGNSATTLGAASTGTFIAGGVALGAGIGLFIASVTRSPKRDASLQRGVNFAVLAAGPDLVLVGARGAW